MLGRGGWWSVHHRRPAGMGGTKSPEFNSPANVVLLCGHGTVGCHGWIEQHRTAAMVDGWLVSQTADPAEVPIVRPTDRPERRGWLLTADWSYEEVVDDGT